METTVSVGSAEYTSNSETADEMVATLSPAETEAPKPKVLVKDGVAVDQEKEKLSEAAAEMGKKGGKAAAEKRAAAKETPDEEPEPEEAKAKDDDEEVDPKKGNPRHDPKARIAQLARERREAETVATQERTRREQLETRLAELERKAAPEKPAEQPAANAKPKLEDFDDHEKYLDARDAYNRKQWEGEQQEKQRNVTLQHQATEYAKNVDTRMRTYEGHVQKAASSDPTFQERIAPVIEALPLPSPFLSNPRELTIAHVLSDQIVLSAEKAPALLLFLAEHPDDLDRILKVRTPDDVKVEVRVILRSLDAATTAASSKPEVSKAPPPARPVAGAPHADSGELDDNAPLSAFVKRFGDRELRSSR